MTEYFSWLEYRVAGNPLSAWLVTAGIVVVVLAIVWGLRSLLKWKLRHAEETATDFDDFLRDVVLRTKLWLIFFIVLYWAVGYLTLGPPFPRLLRGLALIAGLVQLGIWGVGVIEYWVARYRRHRFETDPAAVTTISAFAFFGKIAVWVVIALTVLRNLEIEITPMIAGLGIGGIAVALAAQNILGDLFASLSIVVDKPFVLGDFIVVGSEMGTIEKIGLKTTRVRSLSGEQLVFPNSDLLGSRIRNFKRMVERRSLFSFGVLYSTTPEQLERIPGIVREIIEATPNTRFDRAHFKRFADSALEFEVVFWMLVPDFNSYMDAQQTINLELFSRLQAIGVGFAFPTRTLHVDSWPALRREEDVARS